MQDHRQLEIWQRGMDFTVRIYQFTADLPADERFNLTLQLRKAATSVPLNVAEGAGALTDGDFGRFLGYAYRSLKEASTGLELCGRLYPSLPFAPKATALIEEADQIARMTWTFMQRLGIRSLDWTPPGN